MTHFNEGAIYQTNTGVAHQKMCFFTVSPHYLLIWLSLSFLPLTKNILYCFPTALRLAPNLQTNVQSCSSRLQIYCSFLSSSSLAPALSLSPAFPPFSLLDNSHDMFLPLAWGVPFSARGEYKPNGSSLRHHTDLYKHLHLKIMQNSYSRRCWWSMALILRQFDICSTQKTTPTPLLHKHSTTPSPHGVVKCLFYWLNVLRAVLFPFFSQYTARS